MAAGAEKMLNLMEVGGSLLERVAVGNPLSLVLAASAFALSLGYLFQLGYRRHLGSDQKVSAAGGGRCRDGLRGPGEPGGRCRLGTALGSGPGTALGSAGQAALKARPEGAGPAGGVSSSRAVGQPARFALTGLLGTGGARGTRGWRNPGAFPVLLNRWSLREGAR